MKIVRLIRALALVEASLLVMVAGSVQANDGNYICGEGRDLALVNGEIHTMMDELPRANAVLIRDGKIAAIGDIGEPGPCTDVIDLAGRTVIPGLIDNHVHFLRLGNLPGHHMRSLERAFDVATAQDMIRERVSEIPDGALITAIGGIMPTQFAEGRFPNLHELDAAAPGNPVYLSAFGFGPGQTNSAGRDYLRSLGVTVADDGEVAMGADTGKAFEHLAALMTDADRSREILDEQAFALSVGLTTLMDQSGSVPGVGYLDQATGYDVFLDVLRAGDLHIRTRLFFPALDEAGDQNRRLLRQLDNRWHSFGSDLAKIVGIGEWSVGMEDFARPELDEEARKAIMAIAERGWPYHQHVVSVDEIDRYLGAFEDAAKAGHDLGELSWSLDHINWITKEQVERSNELGIGLAPHGWAYLPSMKVSGPPFRMILDKATVPVGGGSDGARISTLNPWSMIYYMVTGRNHAKELINAGQQITREEAIRVWSGPDQGFFSHETGLLGGIAPGRFGDLVVLDRDFFDEKAVKEDDIRTMSSILTIVGGKIVHDAGMLHDVP